MDKRKLKRELSRLLKHSKEGDTIEMYADGKLYGSYEVSMYVEPDEKTPMEWLNGNLVFASFKGYKEFELKLRVV